VNLHYYPDTDSLYVEFQKRPSVDTREITPDIRLDLDERGKPVGLDIDHASDVLDLDTLEANGLPLKKPVMASRQRVGSASTTR